MNVAPASDVHPHDPGAAPAADAVGSAHRIPQLDGLRGAALVAMLSYSSHRLRGGFVSVDVFFVLSGYLITTLLLRSHRRGSASLGSFYARRARRLFPGLVVFLFGVAVFAVVVARPVDLGQIRGDGLATLAYVYNWHTIVAGHRYGDIFVAPTPLQPMWTLSVEEQFYLAWPLVVGVLVRRARRPLTATLQACAVGAVASGALMVLLSITGVSFTRIYEGTDTRVYAVLAGSGLAAWLLRRPRRFAALPTASVRFAGWAAAALLVALCAGVDLHGPLAFRGGLLLATVATVVLIAALVYPGGQGGEAGQGGRGPGLVFGHPVLVRLGRISYGAYLWHGVTFQVLTPTRTGLGPWTLWALQLAVTFAIAEVSFRLVEEPFLSGRL